MTSLRCYPPPCGPFFMLFVNLWTTTHDLLIWRGETEVSVMPKSSMDHIHMLMTVVCKKSMILTLTMTFEMYCRLPASTLGMFFEGRGRASRGGRQPLREWGNEGMREWGNEGMMDDRGMKGWVYSHQNAVCPSYINLLDMVDSGFQWPPTSEVLSKMLVMGHFYVQFQMEVKQNYFFHNYIVWTNYSLHWTKPSQNLMNTRVALAKNWMITKYSACHFDAARQKKHKNQLKKTP